LRQSEYTPTQTLEFQSRAESTPLGRAAGYEDIGSHKSPKRSFKESNPLPADFYARDPVGYLMNQAEFNRLSPDYFKR